MNHIVKVLDHGFARLVSFTQPVEHDPRFAPGIVAGVNLNAPPAHWTGDLEIVRNARTSYDADWRTGDDADKDERLITRMMTHHHSSPFEAMVFTFEIKAPIFVFRQWHRHRTWSYNEVSARYSELPEEFYTPEAGTITGQHASDKQMRGDEVVEYPEFARAYMLKQANEGFALYHALLQQGVARELARLVLPVATYSRMFATVDLHNLFHFLKLRLDPHAQMEIRVYAEALLKLIEPVCPVAVRTFKEMHGV